MKPNEPLLLGVMDFLRKRKIAAAKKKEAAERRDDNESFMLKNGRFMLEELISSFNGKSNPIRSFSAPVILKATNNFDSTLTCNWEDLYVCYKGIIEDLPVLVKRSWCLTFEEDEMKKITKDIAVSSQMSSHKNVVKLLGCCLEFLYPILVFEYTEKGPLNNLYGGLDSGETLPWNIRLKIAKETACAVTYLHTAFPKRIVHRNITPSKIFLDEKWTAKLSDFSESVSIPEGETHVELSDTYGTTGFIDPDCGSTGCIKETADVFSFGTFLLILITGKPPLPGYGMEGHPIRLKDLVADAREKGHLIEILDPRLVEYVAEEAFELQQMQWNAYIELALKCSRNTGEDRPEMIEVAKELVRIEKSTKLSEMNLDKQTEHVAPTVESIGNIQSQREDNEVARRVHRQHTFP